MAQKTIYISLPKPLPPGAQVKGVYTPQNGFVAKRPITSTYSTNILQFVKDEPSDIQFIEEKCPKKRQKLDHLSYEEKLMRRKLKNRVAAQTARDRKKVRMDQLEDQVSELMEKVSDLSTVVDSLSKHKSQLEKQNSILERKISQCTCNQRLNSESEKPLSNKQELSNKTPVRGVTEQSAALPQPRAVTLRAALRALFLSLIYAQSKAPLEDAKTHLQELSKRDVTLAKHLLQELSNWQTNQELYSWMTHHQPPWIVAH